MKELQIEIYPHDSEVEVAHKINTMELENWINHLTYVRGELKNLVGFYNAQPIEKRMGQEKIIQHFEMKKVDNDVILSSLINFKNSRTAIAECEDTSCDMVFLQEHEKCRRMYLFHIDKYRKLKDQFFSMLQGKFSASKKETMIN
ncbi:hypothetical protein IMCC3317_47120 [Kordia antarctica]|uniref:Uncharacterized protein n=1 Tax=Kordia antarctica TaxID=1218801 RepID=A0A7L4ZRQ2_9FLAO|nr:hypothetical protein [Kordia antarctica]QHI39302.1 hypothetical protein IMCC3317_47120 [Kordia antarctica]